MATTKISVLFFLLIILILNVQPRLVEEEQDKAEKFELGTKVDFNYKKNYFKFDYSASINQAIIFAFHSETVITITDSVGNKIEINEGYDYSYNFQVNLKESGTYYLKIEADSILFYLGDYFISFIPETTKTIDFGEKIYYNDLSFYTNIAFNATKYKVSKLKEEKYVFFGHSEYDQFRGYSSNIFFEICKGEREDCKSNIQIYKFEKETDYTIYFYQYDNRYKEDKEDEEQQTDYPDTDYPDTDYPDSDYPDTDYPDTDYPDTDYPDTDYPDTDYPDSDYPEPDYTDSDYPEPDYPDTDYPEPEPDYDDKGRYSYPLFTFFPITSNTFQNIQDGIYFFEEPKIFIIPKDGKSRKILYENENFKYLAQSEENIAQNYNLLTDLQFNIIDESFTNTSGGNFTIIALIPLGFKNKTKIYVVSEVELKYKEEYIIPAGESKLISFENRDRTVMYNPIYIFSSEKQKIHLTYSEENEGTNQIIQNSILFPIYAPKSQNEYKIKLTTYKSLYALFGIITPDLFETYKSYIRKNYLNEESTLILEKYLNFVQMNIRVRSDHLPWQEFYNFYLKELDIKINLYIRQIYGNTELYECSADSVDLNNLKFLTIPTPECKNKKSIFNRLLTLDGTKILSGYMSYHSYFDIYAEIANDNKIIENKNIASSLLLYLKGNTAKYLKKDVEYTLAFTLDHIIKLDPYTKAEIVIKNAYSTNILNSNNQYIPVVGEGYTIKSNKDAMVYFIGRFQGSQIKIENKPGKIVKISNLQSRDSFLIDFGFKGYNPSGIPNELRLRQYGIVYLDNLYELNKTKLIQGEDLYLYLFYIPSEKDNDKPKIEYIGNNLNNKNNEFNIFYVEKNTNDNEDNQNLFIVNNYNSHFPLYTNIIYCKKNTLIEMFYQGEEGYETKYEFNNNKNEVYYSTQFRLERLDNKFRIKSNESFVFSYSIFDDTDEFTSRINEREILDNLTIIGFNSKNKDNLINIEFLPNYKKSVTRYIIIIAQRSGDNNLENFNNPCYLAKLLKDRPQEVKINSLYNEGEENSISAEVNINSIHNQKGEYIMNIISQELRHNKTIQFYSAFQFDHTFEKKDEPDNTDDVTPDSTDNPVPSGEDDGNSDNTTLLAVILPIGGLIVIVIIVFIIFRLRKSSSSISKEEIEKLTSPQELE